MTRESKPAKGSTPVYRGSTDAKLGQIIRRLHGEAFAPPKPGHVVLPNPPRDECEDQLDLFTGKPKKGRKS